MRISDWSSDVCSSDLCCDAGSIQLPARAFAGDAVTLDIAQVLLGGACASLRQATIGRLIVQARGLDLVDRNAGAGGIHPAKLDLGLGIAGLDRTSVGLGKRVTVRVDLGGCRRIKKK